MEKINSEREQEEKRDTPRDLEVLEARVVAMGKQLREARMETTSQQNRFTEALQRERKHLERVLEDGIIAFQSEQLPSLEKVRGHELQFLKRVKHLQHIWVLLSVAGAVGGDLQNQTEDTSERRRFVWLEQSSLAAGELRELEAKLPPVEEAEGELRSAGDAIDRKLEALREERERIREELDAIKKRKGLPVVRENDSYDGKSARRYETEIESLTQQLLELKEINNKLEARNLESRKKINELNEMIYGLAETEKSHEGVKKIFELMKENEKLNEQIVDYMQRINELEKAVKAKEREEKAASFLPGEKSLKDFIDAHEIMDVSCFTNFRQHICIGLDFFNREAQCRGPR